MRIYTFVFLASSKFASNTVATLFYFAYICQLLTNDLSSIYNNYRIYHRFFSLQAFLLYTKTQTPYIQRATFNMSSCCS